MVIVWGTILALAYRQPVASEPDTKLQVVIMGKERSAVVLGRPAYDADNLLPRVEV